METLHKVRSLFKYFPWNDIYVSFLFLVLISSIIFLVSSFIKPIWFKIWLLKIRINLSFGFNSLFLVLSSLLILFSTIFFSIWFNSIQYFNSVENYLLLITLMLLFSFLFGINAYIIHVSNFRSVKIENLIPSDFIEFNKKYSNCIEFTENEIEFLTGLVDMIPDNLNLTLIGHSKKLDEKYIRNAIENQNFDKNNCPIRIFRINSTDNYYLESYNYALPGGKPPSFTNFILTQKTLFFLNIADLSFGYNIMSFYEIISNNKIEHINQLKKRIKAQIQERKMVTLPTYIEFSTAKTAKINVFLYSYLLDFFGMGQKYVIPQSFMSRTNHLLFAVYRFIITGTFISLLFRYIIK